MADTAPLPFGAPAGRSSPPGEGVPRLLLLGLGWVAGGQAVQILVAVAVGIAVALLHADKPPQGDLTMPLAAVFQLVLLWGATLRGRRVGGGDRRAGLAIGKLRRRRLLAVLLVLHIPIVIVWLAILSGLHWLPRSSPLGVPGTVAPWRLAAMVVVLCGLAPWAEELFFRGWLWTGLRRHWPALPVALVTGAIWLALHALDDWHRPLALLPSAVTFSVARHCCGGTRASWLLHVLNNLFVVAVAGQSLRHGP